MQMSPEETDSDSLSVPYSHMTEEDAQVAFSARKEKIKSMLKARSTVNTPDSLCSKVSNMSKKSQPVQQRFVADPEKISKHSIDLPFESQQVLKERLKVNKNCESDTCKKYDVTEPIYKRTVEWKNNLIKQQEEKSLRKNQEILNQCTFEPSIEKSELRTNDEIYTRNVEWKNMLVNQNELILDQKRIRELEECTFKPTLVSKASPVTHDFLQRNEIWKQKVSKNSKTIEQELRKEHVFNPKIIKTKGKSVTDFDNRFNKFLSKLDEISEKIEKSLNL